MHAISIILSLIHCIFLIALPSHTFLLSQCDPYAELLLQTDASAAVNMLTGLGLVRPGSLPQSGRTFYLISDAALNTLSKMFGGNGSGLSLATDWKSLPALAQTKIVSIFLHHITYTIPANPDGSPTIVATALTAAHTGSDYALTLTSGKQVVQGSKNGPKVQVSAPRMVCGNEVYVTPQVLIPSDLFKLPDTTVEKAVEVVNAMGVAAAVATTPKV